MFTSFPFKYTCCVIYRLNENKYILVADIYMSSALWVDTQIKRTKSFPFKCLSMYWKYCEIKLQFAKLSIDWNKSERRKRKERKSFSPSVVIRQNINSFQFLMTNLHCLLSGVSKIKFLLTIDQIWFIFKFGAFLNRRIGVNETLWVIFD